MSFWYGGYGKKKTVAQLSHAGKKKVAALKKKGFDAKPISIEGRTIASSFWGKGWCSHLESFSDYANRLPRGRSYARHNCICHLDITAGRIDAMVLGSSLYNVSVSINKLSDKKWKAIKKQCSGGIGSLIELLQGKLSDEVMSIVTDRKEGLFPLPKEIKLDCDCPDWATMCKHVAAVLYGIGHRLDSCPDLLFLLRQVSADELISKDLAFPDFNATNSADSINEDDLGNIFGIDFEIEEDSSIVYDPKMQKSRAKKKGKVSKAVIPVFVPTGTNVLKLRKKLGLSILEFAKKATVSSGTIRNWEQKKGALNLQAKSLEALDKLHKTSIQYGRSKK